MIVALSYFQERVNMLIFFRPILIVGPFSQCILEKLCSDHPSKFVHSQPEYMNSDLKTVEKVSTDTVNFDLI